MYHADIILLELNFNERPNVVNSSDLAWKKIKTYILILLQIMWIFYHVD